MTEYDRFTITDAVAWTTFIMTLAILGMVIYLWVKIINIDKGWSQTTEEIKSKIGQLVRQLNKILEAEYNIDVAQQMDINKLKFNTL